jgi:hypothetical protein
VDVSLVGLSNVTKSVLSSKNPKFIKLLGSCCFQADPISFPVYIITRSNITDLANKIIVKSLQQ